MIRKRQKLEDVYIYDAVTSRVLMVESPVRGLSSPFVGEDGHTIDVSTSSAPVVGRGRTNYQRSQLEENRQIHILLYRDEHSASPKIVGRVSRDKGVATLFCTKRVLPDEIRIVNIIRRSLRENGIECYIETDERARYAEERKRRQGDWVRR